MNYFVCFVCFFLFVLFCFVRFWKYFGCSCTIMCFGGKWKQRKHNTFSNNLRCWTNQFLCLQFIHLTMHKSQDWWRDATGDTATSSTQRNHAGFTSSFFCWLTTNSFLSLILTHSSTTSAWFRLTELSPVVFF